jgi:hypothetical protein
MIRILLLNFFLFLFIGSSMAQLNHGDVMPDQIELWNPKTNTAFVLNNNKPDHILVFIYFNQECPYSKIYTERIIKIAKSYYEQNVQIILVHPYTEHPAHDLYQKMNAYAEQHNFPFPYLIEKTPKLLHYLNVEKTPSVYAYKNINHQYIMQYNGAIDDTPTNNKQINEQYLAQAISALLQNKGMKRRQTHFVGSDIEE